MRVADLVEGVAYSDCNARLVVPVFPVTKGWGTKRVHVKGKGKQQEERTVIVQRSSDADPWGSCGPGRSNRRTPVDSEGHQIYDYNSDSIRVTFFKTDRDGSPLEDTATPGVMRLKDMVGTWLEYLSLHIADLQRRYDSDAEKARRRALGREHAHLLTEAGWPSHLAEGSGDRRVEQPRAAYPSIEEAHQSWQERAETDPPPVENYRVTVSVRDQAEFERLLRLLARHTKAEAKRA